MRQVATILGIIDTDVWLATVRWIPGREDATHNEITWENAKLLIFNNFDDDDGYSKSAKRPRSSEEPTTPFPSTKKSSPTSSPTSIIEKHLLGKLSDLPYYRNMINESIKKKGDKTKAAKAQRRCSANKCTKKGSFYCKDDKCSPNTTTNKKDQICVLAFCSHECHSSHICAILMQSA
eukprot:Lithocolla_globosa_v1_NODE_1009_length_2958_cov_13.514296.p1 type:complete len:178 gc:universal NODE_1009_length_2958_cov_13.514296:2121-2654(+)